MFVRGSCLASRNRSKKPATRIDVRALATVWLCLALVLQTPIASFATPPTGVAASATQSVSIATPLPRITPQDVHDDHQAIFESLFPSPFDPEAPSYTLYEDVLGVGIYDGYNQYGEVFTLEVVSDLELDPTHPDANLTPAELQLVSDYSLVHRSVVAYLETGAATHTVWGMTARATVNGVDYSSFALGGTFDGDPEDVDFNTTLALTQDDGGTLTEICIEIPKYCVDEDCADDCYDDYFDSVEEADDALDEASETYSDGMDEAESDMELQEDLLLAAGITLGVALAKATYTYYKGQMACGAVSLVSGPLTGLGCMIGNLAIATAKTVAATATYDLARRTIEDAMEDIQNTIDDLQAEYDQAIQDWMDARDAADEALEDCLDDCPTYLCGVWIICIWIWEPDGEGSGEYYPELGGEIGGG